MKSKSSNKNEIVGSFTSYKKIKMSKMKFRLTAKENFKAEKWKKKHRTKCNKPSLTNFSYTFMPGCIGTVVTISCVGCKKEKDITDVSSW